MQKLNTIYVLFLSILLFSINSSIALCQNFEGEIIYTKKTKKDTTFYSYKIKGNKIRIEELDKQLNPKSYLLVDIDNSKVLNVNPKRKIFIEKSVKLNINDRDTSEFIIYKTENYKNIKGYKCYQWRVRNKKQNTEIAYWVSGEFFGQFSSFIKLVNDNGKNSIYFLHIPNSSGFLPLLIVERSFLREFREQHEVLKIEKKSYSASLFEIPTGYRNYGKN